MVEENQTQTGSLEKRSIIVETTIDENVLSPSAAKSVRFRISKPSGYALGEVDDFIRNIVQPSIDWYAQMLYQRDKTVHYLGGELDKAETDILNLKSQIQFIEYNSKIEEGISRNTDDKEVAAIMQRLEQAEAEALTLKAQLASAGGVDTSQQDAYIAQITAQYNSLLAQYTNDVEALQAELAELAELAEVPVENTDNAEQEAYVAQITAQYTELATRYETDIAELQAEIVKAQSATDIALATSSATADTSETDDYIAQITAQYTELATRYETDIAELQAELSTPRSVSSETSNGPDQETLDYIAQITAQYTELATRYEELQASSPIENKNSDDAETTAYIAQITAQYTELATRYETDIAELQAELNVKPTSTATSSGEVDALKAELEKSRKYAEKLDDYINVLESKIKTGLTDVEEKPKEPKRLALMTEESAKAPVYSEKYANLPHGIRPDDLE